MLSLIIVLTGCGGIRKTGRNRVDSGNAEITLTDVTSQNLSNENFYIQKANVEIENGNTSLTFMATIKYIVPDEYLVSLRLRSGIELARIYLNSDTIMANDRINKIYYSGKPDFLSARYGIPAAVLPVIFGDLVTDPEMNTGPLKCEDGKVMVNTYIKGLKINYEINCGSRKSIAMRQEGSYSGAGGEIKYGKFENQGNKTFPKEISIFHKESGSNLKLIIEKVESPYNGSIEFIPGSRYKRMELR